MSSTKRNLVGRERDPHDYYATPSWCTRAVLRSLPRSVFSPTFEPGVGTGAILRVCRELGHTVTGVEKQAAFCEGLHDVTVGDALAVSWEGHHVISNPPYEFAEAWVKKAVEESDAALFLLRPGYLGSQRRGEFWREHPPDYLGVLSKRPAFRHGRTDSADYAWIGWLGSRPRGECRIEFLHPTYGVAAEASVGDPLGAFQPKTW